MSGLTKNRPPSVSTKIKDIAYKISDNGRCWWIEKYIRNACSSFEVSKLKRRR